ncbi:restriction endonuclease [Bernardetia sp.]|uniref:restriction endonuclease n=1 Tax=Bernardetia sp. TaxID=1937974 RepID=UPI0025C63FE2|nr:restriction endonuclease [Bernardetia sp.]
MNTVQKGDKFENVSYEIVRNIIDSGSLGISPNSCKIYQKKGYYSKDREGNIIFDISVEVFFGNQQEYYFLFLIECKDYSTKNIPVDDIEEFINKTKQVAGVNVKGVFMTTRKLSQGAYNVAKNKGLMIIHVNPEISYNVVLNKKNATQGLDKKKNGKTSIDDLAKTLEEQIIKSYIKRYRDKIKDNEG